MSVKYVTVIKNKNSLKQTVMIKFVTIVFKKWIKMLISAQFVDKRSGFNIISKLY